MRSAAMFAVPPLLRGKRKSLGYLETDANGDIKLITSDAGGGAICLSLAGRKVLGFNYCLRPVFRGLE
jgi:hypothetical protein